MVACVGVCLRGVVVWGVTCYLYLIICHCGHASDVNGRTCLSQGLNGKACTTITRDTLLSFGLMSYLQVRFNIEPNRSEPQHSTVVLLVSSSSPAQVFVVKKPICLDRLGTDNITKHARRTIRGTRCVWTYMQVTEFMDLRAMLFKQYPPGLRAEARRQLEESPL